MLENKLFEALLDVIPFGAYAVDVETYELVYANKILRENMYAPQATYCWEKIYGNEEVCQWCSIYRLKDRSSLVHDVEKNSCEFFDEMDDKWLKSYDEIISWPDGRSVKYSILVNITDHKAIHGAMIQSHAKLAVKSKQIKKTNQNLQITKLKLQKSVNEFKHLFNSTLEGIIILEKNICIDANEQAFKLLGFKESNHLLGKNICDIINHKNEDIFTMDEVTTGSKSLEVEFIKEDGNKFPALIKITPLHSRQSILLSIVDLTELKRKDQIINEQLRISSLEELLKNIAHQWRQPLSIISTSATSLILQKENGILTDEQFNESCNNINEYAQYLSNIIEDFGSFIKGDVELSVLDIKDEINRLLNIVAPSIEIHNINLEVDVDSFKFIGSSNQFIQSLINIINNAKEILEDLLESERYLFISTKCEKEEVILSIKDNGGGIKEEILPKIFDPYFTTKHKSQGKGLGLNMSYDLIVNGMNGTIIAKNTDFEYKNKKYRGAEFIITLASNF